MGGQRLLKLQQAREAGFFPQAPAKLLGLWWDFSPNIWFLFLQFYSSHFLP